MPKYMLRLGPCQAPSLIRNRYRHDQDGRLMENCVSGIGPYLSWYNMGTCGEPISPQTFSKVSERRSIWDQRPGMILGVR